MLVEILLMILIGVLSLGSYKIIKRLELVDSKINELYETRHEVRELHHHIDEILQRVRDFQHNIDETLQRVRDFQHNIDEMRHEQQQMLRDLCENMDQTLQRLGDLNENMHEMLHGQRRIYGLLENTNNRLHFINDRVEQSFPNKKTRLRKKINLTYQFRMRRRLDK